MRERTFGTARLTLIRGDITKQQVDAIVNAANSSLLGGGGVDGAIHRAAGPALLEACRALRDRQGGCPTGEAVATHAGNLAARFVFHAVGPRWNGGGKGEDAKLSSAYRKCMALAREHKVTSIAFPSISTGIYSFPVERAAPLALTAVVDGLAGSAVQEARFVLFSDDDLAVYEAALEAFPPRAS